MTLLKFWLHLKGILSNLPLILSDQYTYKDVSLTRVLVLTFAIVDIKLIDIVVKNISMAPALTPIITAVTTLIGAQLGYNMLKKVTENFQGGKK